MGLRICSLVSLILFLLASVAFASNTTSNEVFRQCFLSRSNTDPQIIYTTGTAAYSTVLRSSVQNIRFLDDPSTTKPAVVVTPTTISHVQAAVICSKANGFGLRVRSGGHDYEGMSYVAEAGAKPFVVLDLSRLRSVSVDYASSSASVQAGATLGELYHAIAANNDTAGFSAGICPTIGVGGHFSGGGIGTITRKYGTSADNIIDAQLVDVNGRLLDRKAMGEDLFWAIRGGGAASFGVVVSYKIKLVAVPPTVTAFNVIKTLSQNATKLAYRWQEIAHMFDENLFIRIVAQATDQTVRVVFNSMYLGKCNDLVGVMEKSFPELGFTTGDCKEMTWLESFLFFNSISGKNVDALLDRTHQESSFKAKSDFVTQPISEENLESIWKFLMQGKDEPLILILDPMGGKMDEIEESAIAFPHRKGNLYNIQYYMRWTETDAAATQKHLSWMQKLYAFMAPYVSSQPRAAYYNYKDIDLGSDLKGFDEANSAWGDKYFKNNFKRLAYVKRRLILRISSGTSRAFHLSLLNAFMEINVTAR